MTARMTSIANDPEALFDVNRPMLKKIFQRHFPNTSGRISFEEFSRFCKASKINPDLISMLDIKRVVGKLCSASQISRAFLSYNQFEQSLKHMAISSFHAAVPLADKLRMLLLHIRNPIKVNYRIALALVLDNKFDKKESSANDSKTQSNAELEDGSEGSLGARVNSAQRLHTTKPSDENLSKAFYRNPALDNSRYNSGRSRGYMPNRQPQRQNIPPHSKSRPVGTIQRSASLTASEFVNRQRKSLAVSPQSPQNQTNQFGISRKSFGSGNFRPTKTASGLTELKTKIDLQKVQSGESTTLSAMTTRDVSRPTIKEVKHIRNLSDDIALEQSSPRFGRDKKIDTIPKSDEEIIQLTQIKSDLFNIESQESALESMNSAFQRFVNQHNRILANYEDKLLPSGCIQKHRDFIISVRSNSFHKSVMKRIIFNSWKNLKHYRKHNIN